MEVPKSKKKKRVLSFNPKTNKMGVGIKKGGSIKFSGGNVKPSSDDNSTDASL